LLYQVLRRGFSLARFPKPKSWTCAPFQTAFRASSEDWKAAERGKDAVKELVDQGLGPQDLKTKIEVLTSNMDSYARRASTDVSVGSEDSALVSRQGTMLSICEEPDSFTGPANAREVAQSDTNRQGTFASLNARPSVKRV